MPLERDNIDIQLDNSQTKIVASVFWKANRVHIRKRRLVVSSRQKHKKYNT